MHSDKYKHAWFLFMYSEIWDKQSNFCSVKPKGRLQSVNKRDTHLRNKIADYTMNRIS